MPIPSKPKSFLTLAMLLMTMAGSLSGCSQPDNPKMAEAPPPPAPKPEELQLPKTDSGKVRDFGAMPKYKKAFNKGQ